MTFARSFIILYRNMCFVHFNFTYLSNYRQPFALQLHILIRQHIYNSLTNESKTIEGCKKKDRIAQKHLFDCYSDGMLMVCLRYVKNLADAEEMMLNGFFKFFESIDRFVYTGKGSIAPWLKKIMINECLMLLRKKEEMKMMDETLAATLPASDDLFGSMNAAGILKLISGLPAGYRTVFNLFAVEGYSHKEIAEMLAITEGTSKSQLNKARALLQKEIQKMEMLP
jgi:RNA polymerase sigma factor (sigma-70 family)